jgi:hypothetical protein
MQAMVIEITFIAFKPFSVDCRLAFSHRCIRKRLTDGKNCSIFFTIFRKGALLMYGYEMVSMMYANTENRVRYIAVYNHRQSREE